MLSATALLAPPPAAALLLPAASPARRLRQNQVYSSSSKLWSGRPVLFSRTASSKLQHLSSSPAASVAITMGPPLPKKPVGHVTGKTDSTVELAFFVDYVCPFSKKAYKMLTEQVIPEYKDKIRFVMYHQVQPWHPQSVMTHEAAIAVADTAGEEAFWKYSTALFDNQTQFFDVKVWDKTRPQIYSELAELAESSAGVKADAVKQLLSLNPANGDNPGTNVIQSVKFAVKYSRTLGVHVSPSTFVNGLFADTSSGWTLDQWKGFLDPLLQ